ncbi:MAG: pyridoxamine 5'-phosphate oxidase family protein [Actinomycetota bacterium]
MTQIPRTARTKLHRAPTRGSYDREAVYAAIDAAIVGHIGYAIDETPYVTPTAVWRDGDHVYWHAADSGRMAQHLADGTAVCVTVTHFDGLVLARSAFHHSVNYRSVMAFGLVERVDALPTKMDALERFIDRLYPDRWQAVRRPDEAELARTSVFRLALDEAVCKARSGPPVDDDADLSLEVWAGTVPVERRFGAPVDAPDLEVAISPGAVGDALN